MRHSKGPGGSYQTQEASAPLAGREESGEARCLRVQVRLDVCSLGEGVQLVIFLLFGMEKAPGEGATMLCLWGLTDARAGGPLSLYSSANSEISCLENKALFQKDSKGLKFYRW